jgi:undecaprenyl-diphosphatase
VRGRTFLWLVVAVSLALALALAALGVGEEEGALSNWQALVLGVVQGATELLPISSSGHLVLVPWLADWQYLKEHDEFNHTFDVALHLGTMLAVLGYFWRDVVTITRAWFRSVARRRVEGPDERMAWFVFVATIPSVIVGALGESLIAEHLGEPWQIAIFLALFAVVLFVADRRPQERDLSGIRVRDALAIGGAQTLALMPGVSRSGITITAGRALGLDRDAAARVSFLLLIPVVFGAVLYKGTTDVLLGELPAGWQGPFLVGVLASVGSGLVAIVGLLGYVRRNDYSVFVVYRLLAAAIVVLLIATGVREAGF